MRKTIKWIGAAVLTPVALFLLLALLLYLPPVQNWAVRHVAAYASASTGMDIRVGRVRLAFPLDLAIDSVMVVQPNDTLPQLRDTIAYIGGMVADVRLLPLLHRRVEIDALDFRAMKVNTAGLIHTVRIKGRVGRLRLQSHGIDLATEHMRVDGALLADADVDIALSDTVPPDTTPSTNFWKIDIDRLHLKRSRLDLHLPGDTMEVAAWMGEATAHNAFLDLHRSLYRVGRLVWEDGRLSYDMNYMARTPGLDVNHLSLDKLSLKADSFFFCNSRLDVLVRRLAFSEKSGLAVRNVTGAFHMDSAALALPHLRLVTPSSVVEGRFRMAMNAFDDRHPGTFTAVIDKALIGSHDLFTFAGLPATVRQQWPRQPLSLRLSATGNLKHLHLRRLDARLPGVAALKASGRIAKVTTPTHLQADLHVEAATGRLNMVTALLDKDLRRTLRLPEGISVKADVNIDGTTYGATFAAAQGGGTLRGTARIDTRRMAYHADVTAAHLPLQHFLPGMGLQPLSGHVAVSGEGTDVLSTKTRLNLNADISRFGFGGYNLDGLDVTARAHGGDIRAHVDADNPLLKGTISVAALTGGRILRGTVSADLADADLKGLGIADSTLRVAGCAYIDWATDLKRYYKAQGMVSELAISDGDTLYHPDDIVLDLLTTRDTTHAVADWGDFHLDANASGGYEPLLDRAQRLAEAWQQQLLARRLDQPQLRALLPHMQLYIATGAANPFARLLRHYGIGVSEFSADLTTSPADGINGDVEALGLTVNAVRLDTVRLALISDSATTVYSAQVRNNKDNPQYTFNALFDGQLTPTGTDITARVYDQNDELGVALTLAGAVEAGGVRVRLTGDDPVLGYKTFHYNDSNYIFLGDNRRVSADMKLTAADGMGVQLYSDDSDEEALQDLTLSLHRFDIEKILSVLPYTPNVKGVLDGDFHAIQTEHRLTVSSSVNVKDMSYENCPMGDIGTEFVYTPQGDSLHQVNGFLFHDGDEVATLSGTYRSEGDGYLDATFGLEHTPLALANGFVPDRLIGLKGYADGNLSVHGPLQKPVVNGEVVLDSGYIFSEPYGVEMRFADDPVTIKDSRLLFENFEFFAHNAQPLDISGSFDFSDLNRMTIDARMRAQNFLLIDSKETMRSETFGKMFVNFFGMMSGPVDALRLRGRLEVLGSTDMTYVLRDSPLSTDNQLEELVTFTSFNDTAANAVVRPPLSGLDMSLSVSVDEGAHLVCDLNADHSNYLDVTGGGDLTLAYGATDGLQLRGRYTVGSGEMKYALPVIPLKTFTIQNGSYIEFRGDPANPTLNITATERTKASVSTDGSSGRMVAFDCGVVISKTLNDMGLEFIIDAPEDMSVSNDLNTKSAEERGKLAVTMLTTGMYLADGNTSSFSMNSALSSFLQSQINNISGTALRTLDLSVGVDNSTTATGATQTDYSFKFAKRFWNNRLNIQVGGKVSTGADVSNQNENFFSNISFEYRLDQNASKYLRLFYDRDSYDWLEGNVGQYGAGFVWKRKLNHFKELFRLKDKTEAPPPMRRDTTKNKK